MAPTATTAPAMIAVLGFALTLVWAWRRVSRSSTIAIVDNEPQKLTQVGIVGLLAIGLFASSVGAGLAVRDTLGSAPPDLTISANRLSAGAVTGQGAPLSSARSAGNSGSKEQCACALDTVLPERQKAAAQPASGRNRSREGNRRRHRRSVRATHTVQRGESLWSIASKQLSGRADDGDIARRVKRLYTVNAREIRSNDPNLIFPGAELRGL